MTIRSKPHVCPPRSWSSYSSSIKNTSGIEEVGRCNEKFVQMQRTKETVENIDNLKENFFLHSSLFHHEGCGATAVRDEAASHHSLQATPLFRLGQVPSNSSQDP